MRKTFFHRNIFTLCLTLFLLGIVSGQAAEDEIQPKIGEPAPLFKLQNVNNELISLSDFRGKFVIIHFAATW
jgi:hypothetical protein